MLRRISPVVGGLVVALLLSIGATVAATGDLKGFAGLHQAIELATGVYAEAVAVVDLDGNHLGDATNPMVVSGSVTATASGPGATVTRSATATQAVTIIGADGDAIGDTDDPIAVVVPGGVTVTDGSDIITVGGVDARATAVVNPSGVQIGSNAAPFITWPASISGSGFFSGLMRADGLGGTGNASLTGNYSGTNGYLWAGPGSGNEMHVCELTITWGGASFAAISAGGFGSGTVLSNGMLLQIMDTAGTDQGAWNASTGAGGSIVATLLGETIASNHQIIGHGTRTGYILGATTTYVYHSTLSLRDQFTGSCLLIDDGEALRIRAQDDHSTKVALFTATVSGIERTAP